MPPTPSSQRMGELHEIHLAEVFGGTKTRASGSQWTDPADGRNHHDDPFAFCWDGKSTKAKSITVTEEMISKIIEQAGGERPALGLRRYANEALTRVAFDWVAIQDADMSELLVAAREGVAARRLLDERDQEIAQLRATMQAEVTSLTYLREETQAALTAAEAERDACRAQLADQARSEAAGTGWRGAATGSEDAAGPPVPEFVPMLPWTIIYQVHGPGGAVEKTGVHYGPSGHKSAFDVHTVIVERSPGSSNRPRLIVNGLRVSHGDLYVDGKRMTRAAWTKPDLEAG